MRKLAIIMALTMVGGLAHAKKNCTDQPKDKWIKEEDGKNVEIYFNPIDGSVVKEKIE
jgi:hypothetical protein